MNTTYQMGDWILPSGNFNPDDLWQLALVGLSLLIFSRIFKSETGSASSGPLSWIKLNLGFLTTWLITLVCFFILTSTEHSASYVRFFTILGGLWIAIGLLTSFIKDPFWARSVAMVGYLITGSYAMAQLNGLGENLQDFHIEVGTLSISAWGIITGLIAFGITMWLSLGLTRLLEARIETVPRLSASLRVLIVKIIRIVFIFVATMIALSSMGVDLSSLTVLGGAIGLGLGFGLQKVVSNFVSGIILLLDNSIKPGDVIEIDGTYGWINNLRARYASVITRDGTEHLIPNEDLITQRVINWSFTDELVRMRVPVGVSYNADPHQCIQLMLDAATGHERVLADPKPVCLLKEFGDNSINLELRFWLSDPANGVGSVKSQVLLKVWDLFKAHNIEIPFPQRDLHIRSSDVEFVKRDMPNPD